MGIFSFMDISSPSKLSYWFLCLVEVAVTEYILGEGPAVLTVNLYEGLLIKRPLEDGAFQWEQLLDGLIQEVPKPQNPESQVVDAYEGKELVLFLGTPITKRVEAWTIKLGWLSFWFLQKRGDEVWAVSVYYNEVGEENSSKLNIRFPDLVANIKQAAAKRSQPINGIISMASASQAGSDQDTAEPRLPMIVTDAHKLKDLYLASGAVYEGDDKTVLPPPPPDGFVPPPTTVVASTTTSSTPETSGPTTTLANQETTTTSSTSTTTTSSITTTTTAVTDGLTLSVSDASATEGEFLVFNVTLNKEPYVWSYVNYSTQDVTAVSEKDYFPAGGTLIFEPFETLQTVKVLIRDDTETEQTETFQLILSQPHNVTIEDPIAVGTITDND